jgi:dihydropteroate synthase
MFYEQTTLNCGGYLLDIIDPIVMGVINVTPDSFYKGSRVTDENTLLKQAERMITEGVAILDIGGMSSRPGAEIIDENVELERVIPAIKSIIKQFPEAIISVDTIRSNVARACVSEGAKMVNDITAGRFDDKMFQTIAEKHTLHRDAHEGGNATNHAKTSQI